MKINMTEIAGTSVLAGALAGRRVLAKLLDLTGREPACPESVFLDFSGVEVATASFLRESILTFRDHVRGRRSTFYPVVANANEVVRDELAELVEARSDVLMACSLTGDQTVISAAPVGKLDPKQQLTFDLVRERGETDAGDLMRDYGKTEMVQQTAWNNRLASLASLGLVVEVSEGRAKRYKPLFMEN